MARAFCMASQMSEAGISKAVTLAVDCMGGDHGPSVTLVACRQFLDKHPQAQLLLVGLPETINAFHHPRASWFAASEVVTMEDSIELALRRKKDSSMRVAIEQVRDGKADVAVSAGNTGALMAIARYVLKTLDGIDRPAIAGQFPNAKGGATTMLDMGANVDCSPQHLLQFALMGTALVSVLHGNENPSVGLLNIGEEDIKGGENIKKTAELLRSAAKSGDLNFYGNVEGDDIFHGTVDIVVCDGFVGNIVLKASEGLAKMMTGMIRTEFNRSWLTKLMALCAMLPLVRVKNRVDHRRYNGAVLLGLRGCVIKSHGSADRLAFAAALERAYEAGKNRMVERIAEAFSAQVTQ
jgi:glycerol-3-phosphate acyltransferase PlsX